jgi:Cu/Zn superoxide dismutase
MLSNRIFIAGAMALAFAIPLAAQAKKSDSKTYPLAAQNASGETGSVTLTPDGDKTMVSVTLKGAPADAQPAHIHPGTCAKLDPAPKYPLSNVVGGKSMTTVDAPIASLTGGGFAVNVHKSTTDLKDYVACGDLASAGSMMKTDSMKSGAMPAATSSP